MKKKVIYIFAALAAVSCNINEIAAPEVPAEEGVASSQDSVLVEIGVTIPASKTPMTKAFADQPGDNIKTLYVAVFDDSGYLCQYGPADCVDGYPTVDSDTDPHVKHYKMMLNVGKTQPRHVHLIANGPATVKFGTEEEVIASMIAYKYPTGDQIGPDVYWNKVLLPDGIKFDPEIVDEHGNKTLIKSSADLLRAVGLIRNFAKFNVKSSASNFVLAEAKILMTPDVSYVSAYNKTTGEFVTNYADLKVSELLQQGYIGSSPASARVIEEFDNPTPVNSAGVVSEFMFEREKPTSAPACVIVGGYYSGSSTKTYYKINLFDETGDYYPIMRNFNYLVTVTAVSAPGKSSIAEAYNTAGSGDISTSFEFEDVASVSNGISSIEVEYTDRVTVSGNPFTLQYRFTPDISVSTTNNKYHFCTEKPTTFPEEGVYVYLGEEGPFGKAIEQIELVSDAGTEGVLRITPVAPSSVSKLQSIHLIGVSKKDGTDVTIQREVNITVREKFNYSIVCDPSVVSAAKGENVNVKLTIPAGLRVSMFPLQVKIEAEKNTLSPKAGENLPVETGKSLYDSNKPGYHFVKTITWEEYYHGDGISSRPSDYTTVYDCLFVTNTANSTTRIVAVNEYFNAAETMLRDANSVSVFSSLQFSSDLYIGDNDSNTKHPKSSRTTSFSFTNVDTTPVTVTLTGAAYEGSEMTLVSGNVYTYTPSASGTQTISGIVANTYSAPVTVALSADGYAPASETKKRYATYPKNTFTGFYNALTENPGVTSWSGNTGNGKVSLGISTSSKLADVPVTVTRTQTSEVAAPSLTGATVTRTGGSGNRKYTYTATIANYSAGNTYYYSTSTTGTKKEISVDGAHKFTLNQLSNGTVYIYTKSGNIFSNATSIEYNNGNTRVNAGSSVPVYSYQCAGPTDDVKVEFSSEVTNETKLVVYYGTTKGWENSVSYMYW
ncbi:MAG: hypothetical protein MJZ09_02790 [Bacteroidales bacterium]|nr:hypothetical protein [Bacteroidales bacterium]